MAHAAVAVLVSGTFMGASALHSVTAMLPDAVRPVPG